MLILPNNHYAVPNMQNLCEASQKSLQQVLEIEFSPFFLALQFLATQHRMAAQIPGILLEKKKVVSICT